MAKQLRIDYEDYRKLITKRAWQWSEKTGWDFQEFVAEGNLVFCKIQCHFNSSKSIFSTYLTNSLNFHFRDITREWREEPKYVEISEQIPSRDGSPERAAALKEMIRHLRKDAQFLVESVLETPSDLIWMLGGREKKRVTITKYALQKYLVQKKGWTGNRCWRAFDQIKVALDTL